MSKFILLPFFLLSFISIKAQFTPEVVYTTGHTTQINAMVVSGNHQFLASAGNNKLIKIWDVSSGREYRTITGSDGRVGELFFADDHQTLVGITSNNEMIGWNVVTGKKQFETTANGRLKLGAGFISSTKEILFSNEQGQLARFNVETQKETVIDAEIYCSGIVIDQRKKRTYVTTHLGEVKVYDLKTFKRLEDFKLSGGQVNPMMPPLLTANGNFMVNVLADNAIRLIDLNKQKVVFEQKVFPDLISHFSIDPAKPYVYFTFHSGEVTIYNYKSNKVIDRFKEQETYFVNGLTTYPKGEVLILSYFDLIRFYNVKSKQFFKRLSPKVSSIDNMSYDQQGKYLAVARTQKGKVEIWDLTRNKIVKELFGIYPCEFTPDGSRLLLGNGLGFTSYDVNTWDIIGKYDTKGKVLQKVAFSNDGNYLAAAGYTDEILIFDTKTRKCIKTIKGNQNVTALDFHPTKPLLAASAYDNTVKVWQYLKAKLEHTIRDHEMTVSGVKYSPDGTKLVSTSWDKTIRMYQSDNYTLLRKWSGHHGNIAGLDFNQKGDVLMTYGTNYGVYEADNSVIFWQLDGTKIHEIESHTSGVSQAFFDLEADYVLSSSKDGSIKINDYKQKKVIATYVAVEGDEFIIYTPENYYMASKKALSAIAFRIGPNLVSFEQFDINLNRPDIVAKAIGKSPEQLIRAYEYLYQKRLRKFNLEEGNLKIDYNLPNLKIENQVPLVTSASEIELSIKAWDEKHTINQINVYVNGTPIFGEQGFRPTEKVKAYRKVIQVPIIKDLNKIQVSCINSNGAESFFDTKEVVREVANGKNDLYVVAIGVSNYKDSRFNLTYPTKDAKDVLTKLKASQGIYDKIYTKELLNEAVNRENIIELSRFFEKCKPDDVAAIFIAGHGLLDENFDYYFGTHDIDFDHPADKGLPYDDIHALLNSIKAYRKLLIMDTCHSGELDKEEVEAGGSEPEIEEGNIEFRSAGSSVSLKDAFGFENALELTQDLFSDTRKGSGAIVISSAGGAEYAMESDEWENGLFTYVFLSGLTDVNTDLNKDGQIQISEIRAHVNKSVAQLSGGRQVPSSREENISADFSIYSP